MVFAEERVLRHSVHNTLQLLLQLGVLLATLLMAIENPESYAILCWHGTTALIQ
jgi:hypothetical protein